MSSSGSTSDGSEMILTAADKSYLSHANKAFDELCDSDDNITIEELRIFLGVMIPTENWISEKEIAWMITPDKTEEKVTTKKGHLAQL